MGEMEGNMRLASRFFKIKAKEFRIKVDELSMGRSVLIKEKVGNRVFHISLELGCVVWLINELQGFLNNTETAAIRKFRGDSYLLWLERSINIRGAHLRVSKCVHGFVKSIVVPQGRHNEGWLRLKENLQLCFKGKGDRSTVKVGCRAEAERSGECSKTYKQAVETRCVEGAVPKQSVRLDLISNWSWVVVCERCINLGRK